MIEPPFRVLVTGANGFIGKNLIVRLGELSTFSVITFTREDDFTALPELISQVDSVIHLASENRPQDERAFDQVNRGLTVSICDAIKQEFETNNRKVQLILASSIQAEKENLYGLSKLAAEEAVQLLSVEINNSVVIFRFPGVFGKWCKPNYNSVVATFCHNIARDLPIQIKESENNLKLVYVDDVVDALIEALESPKAGITKGTVQPIYDIKLGELAAQIKAFSNCRTTLTSECVGIGLVRALYATYVSYLPIEKFIYGVESHSDPRGTFVEILKTTNSGQFSYFTTFPGVTRGRHYHHTKTEKFLVIKGRALFRFRHLLTQELVEIHTSDKKPEIVDSIPGWSHDITNIGEEEMIVILWANEVFDRNKPDTVSSKI